MYEEGPSRLPGVLAWRSEAGPAGSTVRVLPDGCTDLMWWGDELVVAGPDTTAFLATSPPGACCFALRFRTGVGPALLGVPADELRDRRVPLADLWGPVRLTGTDPVAALEHLVASRWRDPDPLLTGVAGLLRAGEPVAAVAARTGLSARQLHRRSVTAFGYGPKLLARIFRLQRALRRARAGTPFATVAATAGYADQAHLSREVRELAGVPLGTLLH